MKLTVDARPLQALEGCRVARPPGFDGGIEIVEASMEPRAFPLRVSTGLGICLKRARAAHDVVADGRAIVYPAEAVSVRAPGCAWRSAATDAWFLSIDLEPALLPAGTWAAPMSFVPASSLPSVEATTALLLAGAAEALPASEALAAMVQALGDVGLLRADALFEEGAPGAAERARELLADTDGEALSLEALATAAGSNKYVLLRAFKRRYGITPHAYRVCVQVEAARSLLARRVPLAEAALRAGFSDQSHLGRHFKRVVGMTPHAYAARAAASAAKR
jgi:AraC-like DNA-binding protein